MATAVAASESVVVATARVGTLGSCSVGVMAVLGGPARAKIVVAGRSAGVAWEATQEVVAEQEVLAAGARYQVGAILVGLAPGVGNVRFVPEGPSAWPDSAVVLEAGGELRLDGPEVEAATDVQVTGWPDGAAMVEWWPARLSRADTDPAQVHSERLAVGSKTVLGRAEVTVLAVETGGADHKARVILQLLPRH